ncbi:hypothetical protein [Terracoccus sp. 273MFTsu3.1]|uniref:hypothetical protein n=1 Tax=Terracoccus sp. 273MFTsu3.1 TaxID=1172188 RepID=UPI0012DF6BAB|nr:hypothetical protein [Terracoccus sp. 273MFTsu3.1]
MTAANASPQGANDEGRLKAFGLSSELLHAGLRAGASRAANRSALALRSSAGTDIYHDGMEQFAQLLHADGWRLRSVDQQPRLLHPQGLVAFAISSGVNVGKSTMRMPRTKRKGLATRKALATPPRPASLFDFNDAAHEGQMSGAASDAPLYFLLCERIHHGNGLLLEFSRPAQMTWGGSVTEWADRIAVEHLDLDGDLSVFDNPDGDDAFEVQVEPR